MRVILEYRVIGLTLTLPTLPSACRNSKKEKAKKKEISLGSAITRRERKGRRGWIGDNRHKGSANCSIRGSRGLGSRSGSAGQRETRGRRVTQEKIGARSFNVDDRCARASSRDEFLPPSDDVADPTTSEFISFDFRFAQGGPSEHLSYIYI